MSMRIIDLQRRLREIGRIRIGEQVATSSGGRKRPAKLDVFRLTSRDRTVIEAAAALYGGTAEPWDDAPDGGQWQVKTTATEFTVVVPPGDMSFSQSYEQWTAGGCKVRCDGQWDHVGDKACHCDPTGRACAIHTRLSVMLPELPGLGVWRLDTSGYYAAVELGGVVDLAAGFAERGQMLPARLRLEQRSVKRPKARGDGVETRRYAVPVLDLDVHPLALAGGTTTPVAIGDGSGPRFTPVPADLDTPPALPVAEQVRGLEAGEQARKPRANAAAVIPPTGIAPRTTTEVGAADELAPPSLPIGQAPAKKAPAKKAPAKKAAGLKLATATMCTAIQSSIDALEQDQRQALGAWWAGEGFPRLASGDLAEVDAAKIEARIASMAGALTADDNGDPLPSPAVRNRKMWAMVADAWPDDDVDARDRKRKALIALASEAGSESSKDLGDGEWDDLFHTLEQVAEGGLELARRSTGDYELRPKVGCGVKLPAYLDTDREALAREEYAADEAGEEPEVQS